jgi:hypothetical protein
MYFLTLLSLVGVLGPVSGYEGRSAWRRSEATSYARAADVAADTLLRLVKRGDYVQTATELVETVSPDTAFRLVDDHYIGSNGVGHVRFKQTANGLDIDNADFTVHVSVVMGLYERQRSRVLNFRVGGSRWHRFLLQQLILRW